MRRGSNARRGRRFVVLRALLRQRRRLLLAGLSIALGVGYLAGTLGLLGRIGSGLDQLASVSADQAEIVIEGEVAYESPLEKVRRLVPSALAELASGVDGVDTVSHRLEGTATVLDASGVPVAAPGLSEQPLLMNWPEDPEVSNLVLSSGVAPSSDGEVVVDSHTAEVAGVDIGDEVRVAGLAKLGEYEVVGIADSASAGRAEGSSLVVMTTEESRLMLDQPLDDNRIAVRTDDGADVDAVMSQIGAMAGPGVEVTDGATAAVHAQESLTRSFTLVRVLVTGFGVLALLVGMVTVANSLTLLHAQRRRMFAGFRLVGASRGQLRRAALGEAVILAAVSALVGVPLGLLLAVLIERALGTMGTAVPTAGPLLTPQAALAAAGIGLLATLTAAWRPVRNACGVAPIEAVAETEPRSSRRWSPMVVATSRAAVLAVAAAAVGTIAGATVRDTAIAAAVTFVAVLILGLLPTLLARAVSATIRVLPLRPRPLRVVAARDALRNPRRTAATTAAVLLAAAVVSSLAVFLQSFTASLDDAVDGLVTADLVVDSETFTRGGLPADLVEQLGFVEGVEASSGWQLGRGTVNGFAVRMTGLDGASATEVVAPGFVGGTPDGIEPDSAWISESLAERSGLGVGDLLPVTFYSGGFENLEVSAVYDNGGPVLGDVVTDRAVLTRQVPATTDLAALVRTDGTEATAARVSELATSYGVTAVTTPQEFVGDRGEVLRGFERVVLWMLLFTLLQALVGVVNTLVLSVGERRREFGLLRVAGASRRAVLRMVLLEGVSFSSVGTLLGIAAGTGAAALAVWALASLGLGVFSMPVATVVAIALVALVAGVAASWIPARMASAVPPLEALADTGSELGRRVGALTAAPERVTAPAVAVPEPIAGVPATAGVPGTAGVPATAVAAPEPVVVGAQVPPPFDPSRLPAPVVLAADERIEADRILSVAVLDGSSVTTLAADSAEAAALLELYGLVGDGTQGSPRFATEVAGSPTIAAAGAEESSAQPDSEQDSAATAIGMLLSEALFGEPVPSEPVPSEPTATTGTAQPVVTPPPFHGVPGQPVGGASEATPVPPEPWSDTDRGGHEQDGSELEDSAPAERGREQRRGLRRSRRRDPADRRPPRRVRRGSLPAAAEGWVAPSPEHDAESQQPAPDTAAPDTPASDTAATSATAAAQPSGSTAVPGPDMASVVARLDAHTQQRWAAVLHSMNAALASGEQVDSLVCGRVHAAPAAVSRTDRRLLVVAERPGRMAVESLHPVATGVVVRPGPAGTVVVVLIDRGRPLEVTDVTDTAAAEALVLRDALKR